MKKNILSIAAALTLCLAANSQEVMKVELKNGTVATYNVEDINRFYFEGAQQQEELATDCKISIMDEVIMTNAFAEEFVYDKGIEKVYFILAAADQVSQLSEEQLIMALLNNGTVKGKDQTIVTLGGLPEGTNCVLLYMGVNAAGKRGQLYQRHFTTKIVANQSVAKVVNPEYTNEEFIVTIEIGNDVLDYYALADVGFDLPKFEANPAEYGLAWKKMIAAGEAPGPYYTTKTFYQPRPNGENTLRMLTWTRDRQGEFSGIIWSERITTNSQSRTGMPVKLKDNQTVINAYSKDELMKKLNLKQESATGDFAE